MSYIDDEFLIWVKLSEEYEEEVLYVNPKFFEELYEKIKESSYVRDSFYSRGSSCSAPRIEIQFYRENMPKVMKILEDYMENYKDIEGPYDLLNITVVGEEHKKVMDEYVEIYMERKYAEVFEILQYRLRKREQERKAKELEKQAPEEFEYPVRFSPEMKAYIEELRHVMKGLDGIGSIGQIFTKKLLISIDDGWGYSAFLKTIRTEIGRYYGNDVEDIDIDEVSLGTGNGIEPWRSQVGTIKRLAAGCEKNKNFAIVAYDMREWTSKISSADFLNEIRRIGQYAKNVLVVFRFSYMEMKKIKAIEESFSDVVSIRSIVIPPVTPENMVVYLKDKIKETKFEVDENCDDILEQWICQEKNEGNFFGYKTLDKMAGELIYQKALKSDLANTSESEFKKIGVKDVENMVHNVVLDCTDAYELLNELIGIAQVKTKVREIVAQIKLQMAMESQGKKIDKPSMHMLFLGNPGTGKTTVARIIGQIFKQEGILKKGFFYEKMGNDFVARYVGTAAETMRSACRDAYGSVLFIDEAYGMNVGTSKGTTADEIVPVLVAEMENHRSDLCVILAGYKDEMYEFLKTNSGLESRIPHIIEFPNYSKDELMEIFLHMVKKNFAYEDDMMETVSEYINNIPEEQFETKEFSNARFIRNLYEHLWGKAAYRMSLSGKSEIVLKKEDWVNVMAEENFVDMVEEKPKRTIGFKA